MWLGIRSIEDRSDHLIWTEFDILKISHQKLVFINRWKKKEEMDIAREQNREFEEVSGPFRTDPTI